VADAEGMSTTETLAQRRRIIQYNDYSFEEQSPRFEEVQHYKPLYQQQVKYLTKRDNVDPTFQDGQQKNYFSKFPYDPIQLGTINFEGEFSVFCLQLASVNHF